MLKNLNPSKLCKVTNLLCGISIKASEDTFFDIPQNAKLVPGYNIMLHCGQILK